jgi:NADH-quinone oxidoreductase subunit G/[NiFe] hydrogenase diaphorase moiety small subunit
MAQVKATNVSNEEPGNIGLITVVIDDKEVSVEAGTTILDAARKAGVEIPTLCYHPDLTISGSCRMCVVEVEGQRLLQAACAYPVSANMKVRTTTPDIRRSRKNILDLLLSEHVGQCYTCKRSKNCELRTLAEEYGVDGFTFGHEDEPFYDIIDDGVITRDMNKCIGCFRCVRTCKGLQTVYALGKAERGENVCIATFDDRKMLDSLCVACGQCINRCPTAALTERDDTDEVWAAIEDPTKHVVIQTAPAPRAGLGEEFGYEPGTSVTKNLNTALHRMGFDKVFDTNMTADLTIMEEGTELLLRLKKALVEKKEVALPQITSCSPGWIKFMEEFGDDLLPHLSSCKSPQQMFGAIIKSYYAELQGIDPKNIVSVSLMPCSAKKFQSGRPEMKDSGHRDVDLVLTTREMGKMIKEAGIPDLLNLPKSEFDNPSGLGSGAGIIFGATGGVMEAAIRTAYAIVTGEDVPFENLNIIPVRGMDGVKTAELPIPKAVDAWKFLEGATLKVMVCHGLKNARWMIEKLRKGELSDYHFIEVMACPGGCLGGGGQPIPTTPEIRQARARAIYEEDMNMPLRNSHDHPVVKKLYEDYFTDGPCGHKSHVLLHTHYTKRGKKLV